MPTSVWRSRDFLLVLGGGLVNNIGDWLLAVALPAFVYTETGSGAATSAIVVIELLVSIAFGPYGGSLADRFDLRLTVVVTNVLQAITLLPLLAVDEHRLWPAFVVAALQGLLQEVNNPASFALVPRIVAPDQLLQANAANGAAGSIARLVGAPLGGIAVAAGGLPAVVIADGATFLVVALATAFVRTPTSSLASGVSDEGGNPVRPRVRDGWAVVRNDPPLFGYLVVQSLANLGFAMFPVLFIAFVVDVLDGDEATVGLIRGMAALGGLVASVVVARVARRAAPTALMVIGYTGLGAIAFVFVNVSFLTTALWLFFVLFAASGFPNVTSQLGAVGSAQQLCPPEVLGRFQGLLSATGSVGAIVGTVAVGALIDTVRVEVLLNIQAAVYTACGVAAYFLVVRRRGVSSGVREPVPSGAR
jgi:predicted MFS family arabinose efflux permease